MLDVDEHWRDFILYLGLVAHSLGHHENNDLSVICFSDIILKFQVKGLLKEKKLEQLVDSDMEGNYIEEEVEQLIQVALLCTQGSPMERPKMSEVVRMLEGDGLAERWEEWQKEEMFRQDFNHTPHPNNTWIVDSTSHIQPDELSGPRWYGSLLDVLFVCESDIYNICAYRFLLLFPILMSSLYYKLYLFRQCCNFL